MRSSLLPALLTLLLILALPLVIARPAWASESIELRSGRTLLLQDYRFEAAGLRITQRTSGGGTLGVRLAYRTIVPTSLDALFRRHATDVKPAEQLRLAKLALTIELPGTSEALFARIAAHHAPLRSEAEAGLALARRGVVVRALASITEGVRAGKDPTVLRDRIDALAGGPYADALRPAERLQLAALHRLIAPKPPLPGAAGPAAPQQPDLTKDLRAKFEAAIALRDRAADPKLSPKVVRKLLDRAAKDLRGLRKAIRALPAGVPPQQIHAMHRDATHALADTLVELADLHRQAGRFEHARAYVRSALLFRPEHPGALQQRGLIEDDIAAAAAYDPYQAAWDPYYGSGLDTYWIGPSIFRSPFRSYRTSRVRGYSVRGHRHHRGGGSRRAVGTRR